MTTNHLLDACVGIPRLKSAHIFAAMPRWHIVIIPTVDSKDRCMRQIRKEKVIVVWG